MRAAVWLLILGLSALPDGLIAAQDEQIGPEVRAFLDGQRDEENDLESLLRNNEISRKEYARAKNKLLIARQTVLDRARRTGEDRVPEIHVMTAAEVGQYIEGGPKALRRVKPGEVVAERWLYIGKTARGEVYYIFERLKRL